MMVSQGINRLKYWVRRAALSLRSQVIILMYHRIYEARPDPWLLCVKPDHFSEQMEYLNQNFHIMSLNMLVHSLLSGKIPKRAVVLTFDDGYVDSLWNAKPILEKYEIPATVFVTSGYVGLNQEFWWDELERLLLSTPSLPECLKMMLHGKEYKWILDKWANLPKSNDSSNLHWNVLFTEDPTPRHSACQEIHSLLRPLRHEEQQMALDALNSFALTNGRQPRPGYRALKPEEICQLAKDGLIEIGAHTVTHPILALQPYETQKREIVESKTFLEKILGKMVTSFCYPYGGRGDINPTTLMLVKQSGFSAALTTIPGSVVPQANIYFLPRFMVHSWDGEEFGRRLWEFFHWQ